MTAFFRDKNAGTRWDEQRRQAGIMRMQRAWRRWHLHVWELTGPPQTWGEQLEAHYRRQPVFAIVGGLGGADWGPIHEFSERFRVPCIFPQAEVPGRSKPRFYTTYLSRGVLLEADVLARHLADRADAAHLIQVFRPDSLGEIAAQELRAVLPGAADRLTDLVLEGPADAAFWQTLAREHSGMPLILWLDAADLAAARQPLAQPPAATTTYLSPTLLDGIPVAEALAGAAPLAVYPWDSPAARDAAQARTRAWLKGKGITAGDDAVQTDTLFALTIVGDVLSHILDSFSRDYFIERIEHAVQQSLVPSSFPHVSLGPDQRFAAKGSYVVRLDAERGFTAVTGWIVP
jgi:hypothetical protein